MEGYGYRESIHYKQNLKIKRILPNLSNGDNVKQLLLARSIYFINPEETGPLTKKKEPSCYLSYILI
jgi:hypothetical protein